MWASDWATFVMSLRDNGSLVYLHEELIGNFSCALFDITPSTYTGTINPDLGLEHKFRSMHHGKGLEFRSFCQLGSLMFRSIDQGEEREGGKIKMI